ncbi:TetR/AcrR family transcriptional regulator [Streptomyces sp. NPDC001922]|uniref:TetR/AcrR family transcriptional regulator n=1 Tax=Streptomyces sp. NPDC001922 TaxID=3364624 RepID=UPI0036BAED81
MPPADKPIPRRVPAGAAVLQEDVTAAIRAAVFQELASVGYGRMSIEAVARRAGVGKTAVYRRWSSKLQMVIGVVSDVAVQDTPVPDTGSLPGDLRVLLGSTAQALQHPLASQIVPDLLAEAARNTEIAQTLQSALGKAQEKVGAEIVRNAVARGELPAGTDARLALDVVIGPLYWRLAVVRSPLPDGYLDHLARTTAAALQAGSTP